MQFNLEIKFRPGRLGKKPDALTRRWDIYEDANPTLQSNHRSLFNHSQLENGLTNPNHLLPHLWTATVVDPVALLADIREALAQDPESRKYTNTSDNSCWALQPGGFLYFEGQKYVPDLNQLRLRVLKMKHDHILAEHPGQSKTYQLVRRDFNWPKLREFITDYVSSCSVCSRNKAKHHKPYGLLKQLPVPPQP